MTAKFTFTTLNHVQTHAQTQTNYLFQDLKFKRVSTQLDFIVTYLVSAQIHHQTSRGGRFSRCLSGYLFFCR